MMDLALNISLTVAGVIAGLVGGWFTARHFYLRSLADAKQAQQEAVEQVRDLAEQMRKMAEQHPRVLAAAQIEAKLDHEDRICEAVREGGFATTLAIATMMEAIASHQVSPQHHGQIDSAASNVWPSVRPLLTVLHDDQLVQRTGEWFDDLKETFAALAVGPLSEPERQRLKRLVNHGSGLRNTFNARWPER